jgi:hypothetical protein
MRSPTDPGPETWMTMLTDRGYAALRGAATLTHMLPSLSPWCTSDVIPEPIRPDEAAIIDTFEQCIARLAATELIERLSGDGVVG